MQDNKVKHWNGVQNLVNLNYVDLSFSKHMTEIPNLSRASNLQYLILNGCSSLLEITPSSIQNLNKLVELDLRNCIRLISLPDGIQSKSINLYRCYTLEIAPKISCKVENLYLSGTAIKESLFVEHPSRLVQLDLSHCSSLESLSSSICKLKYLEVLKLFRRSKLKRLPHDFGDLEASEFLDSKATIIEEVPSSILHLPKLCKLELCRVDDEPTPLNWVLNSSSGSNSIEWIDFSNFQMTKLPDNLGQLSFLEDLYLSGNNFKSMPENIKGLSKLKFLDISNSRRLQLLPELPMGVGVMANDSSSLQSISDPLFLLLPHWRRRKTSFIHCFKLDLSKILHEESCREFCANICFPGDEIPKWFTFQNTGSYITLDQSLDWHNKNFLGFLASIVVSPGFYCGIHFYVVTCYCSVKSEDGEEQIYITEHEL
ncbi:disease resistance-like protein DSC1 [Pistacia vera]|uniref:disease resistance-like protein DSC1 n=1 Tax=Pistacia vera TaxID=55513 RepID=UPI001262FF1B|nr:disease resistance-like protein DSC1 [Pistacia vera]